MPSSRDDAGVRVNSRLTIPASELELSFTPSGGPGGQHANRSSTRVELAWNVDGSTVLGPRQAERIKTRLRKRIDSSGTLRLSSDKHRSQWRNREEVRARLAALVADALKTTKPRVATSATRASKERRLREKKRRAELKRLRADVPRE